MATVVVCDDDGLLRRTVSDLCEAAGLQVVAETDRGIDALELVRRFKVDILVLDLSLGDGSSGEHTLEQLQEVEPPPIVVVFTAYASNAANLIRLGAREVIEKPDLVRLAEVLGRLAITTAGDTGGGEERRRTSRAVAPAADRWRSPSGIGSSSDLRHTLQDVVEGDALIVVSVRGLDELEAAVGPVLTADCRLAVGRLLRTTLRIQDLVHEQPDVDGFVGVLRGGDARAADAVWNRLIALDHRRRSARRDDRRLCPGRPRRAHSGARPRRVGSPHRRPRRPQPDQRLISGGRGRPPRRRRRQQRRGATTAHRRVGRRSTARRSTPGW